MIKGIVLDMGGVIVELDHGACLRAFHERCGFDRVEEFLDPCVQQGFFQKMEQGLETAEQFYAQVREYCRPGTTDKDIRDSFCSLVTVLHQDKIDLLRDLAKRYPLYMLSNNNPVVTPYCKDIFRRHGIPMEEIFKELYISYEMGMMKPNVEIFEEAIRRTGFKADELLFIDDSEANAEAGRKAGMKSLFYKRGTDLRELIESALD